jgi:hypothetical protein
MTLETIRYDREKLYQEVWAEPMLAVAARYGVSSVALAKTCRKLGVPTPTRGYWALKPAGRAATKPRLPAPKPGQQVVITRERSSDPNAVWRRREPPRLEKDAGPRIVVPPALANPHKLVAASITKVRQASASAGWHAAPDEARLDIRVTAATLERAVLLMDTLIKGLEMRGYLIEVTAPEPRPEPDRSGRAQAATPSVTRVSVDGAFVALHILEMIENGQPSGELCISISPIPAGWNVRTAWHDGKRPLERCLGDVVRGIVTLARALLQDRTERESTKREADEKEQARKADWDRYHLQQKKLDDLQSRVLDHVQAEEIRGFLRAIEAYIAVNGPVGPEPEIAAWMDWARGIAQTLQENAIRTLLTYRPRPSE